MGRKSVLCSVLTAAFLATLPAKANEEVITAYDARSVGMGLTGTAHVTNAAATLHNVANIGAVKRLDLVLSLGPNISRVKAPYNQNSAAGALTGIVQATSKYELTPLGFVGLAYRAHSRVSVGLAGMMARVAGMQYTDVPLSILDSRAPQQQRGTATALQVLWDARLPVAINVTPWLTVGGAYRVGFAHQLLSYKVGDTTFAKQSYSGQRFTGAQAGISLKPLPWMRAGFAYRSKLNIPVKGTNMQLGAQGPQSAPATNTVLEPHQVTGGVAFNLANNQLILALDYKYWFFKDAVSGLDATTRAATQDAMSGNIGAEYYVTTHWPVRVGFLLGRSSVTKSGAFAVRSTPGLQIGGTVGAGYHVERVDFDLGVGYGAVNTNLGSPPAAIAGKYGLDVWLVNLSVNVRI